MNLKSLLIFLFVFLLTINVGSAATPPIVYVATDGTGDYNCDGTADQVQLNDALLFAYNNRASGYTTVYLRSGTYWIDSQIFLTNNIILTGDSTAKIKLIDDCPWQRTYTGALAYSSSGTQTLPMIMARSGHNTGFTITNIIIDGNSQGNTDVPFGQGWYNLLNFYQCTHVSLDHVTLQYGKSDGFKFQSGSYASMTNCNVNKIGHDAGYFLYSNYITFTNNTVFTRTNSACRISSGAHIVIAHNHIYSGTITTADGGGSSTGPGIEIDLDGSEYCYDCEIYDNVIHDLRGSGIWMTSSNADGGRDVHIYNNIIYNVGKYTYFNGYSMGGITLFQFNNSIIENNVFNEAGVGALIYAEGTDSPTGGSKLYHTTFRNNIVINTNDQLPTTSGGSTYIYAVPIMNHDGTYSRIHAYNNDFYNNYNNLVYKSHVATDSNNLAVDPQFVDATNHNYHLKSTAGHYNNGNWVIDAVSSSLIDAGLSTSDYSDEPEPNGNRINIDAYGNTAQASKSPTETTPTPDPDPVNPEPEPVVVEIQDPVDNRLRSLSPTTVYSSSTYIDAGNIASTSSTVRDLIWYDLTNYNDSSQVTSAELKLFWYYQTSRTSDTIIEIYRPAATWSTSTATWNNANTWYDANGVLGGSTPYDSITFPSTQSPTNSYYSFDVTDLVQAYAEGTYTNTGFLIKTRTENNDYVAFYSLDNGNSSRVPVLDISSTAVNIEAYSPTSNPTKTVGQSQIFTTQLTATGDVEWSVDGIIKEYDLNTQHASYTFTPTAARTYTIRAETPTAYKSWSLTATSNSTSNPASNVTTSVSGIAYVATTGSDTTGNGSISLPYATITKALTTTAPTIMVKGGNYNLATPITRSNVIIKGYNGNAVFDHSDDTGTAFTVTGRTNITLQNLIIRNYEYGVYGTTSLTNLIVENCSITNNAQDSIWLDQINANGIYLYNSTFADNEYHGVHLSNQEVGKLIQNVVIENNDFYDCPSNLLDFRSNVTDVTCSENYYYFNSDEIQQVGVYIHNNNLETFSFTNEEFYNCARPMEILNGQSVTVTSSHWNNIHDATAPPVYVNGVEFPVTASGRAILFGGNSPTNEGTTYTGYNNVFTDIEQTLFPTYSEAVGTPVTVREYNATLSNVSKIFSTSSCIENIAIQTYHNSPVKTFEFTNANALTWKWYVNNTLVETDTNTYFPSRIQSGMTTGTNVSAICTDNGDTLRMTWIRGNGTEVNGVIYTRYPYTSSPKQLKGNDVSFSLTLNGNADTKWYVDNVLVETDSSSSPTYIYNATVSGTHVVKAVTSEETYTWNLNVENPQQKFYVGVITRIGQVLSWDTRKPTYDDQVVDGFTIITR
jgi:hypothetical protein